MALAAASPPSSDVKVLHAAADLLLGTRCVGCRLPGALACRRCQAEVARHQHLVRWLPEVSLVVTAATWYQGAAAQLLRAHKDAEAWSLAGLLGEAVATSLNDLTRLNVVDGHSIVVPIPSWPHQVRHRGYDHAATLARVAARRLGWRAPRRLLTRRGQGPQQAGLGLAERVVNRGATLSARPGQGVVVLVDDIVTTGATVIEATRTLRAAGWRVGGVATVALTPRHHPGSYLTSPAAGHTKEMAADERDPLIETPPSRAFEG